ncbi:hypothetical protein FACS1894133_0430 [Clostridia bacterium]|nr:hypothetical protein FACS1894133_0360 [Clostridia bacterium]GHU57494.1 hypothetical protein FACS1894133_0430 [Clostridia bacterium]
MLKIRTRLISAVMTVIVIVTAAFGGAMSVAADSREGAAKPYALGSKAEYNLTDDVKDNTYSFTLTARANITVNLFSEAKTTGYYLYNSKGTKIETLRYKADYGVADSSEVTWNEEAKKAEATITYTNLFPDTYYLELRKWIAGGQYFEMTITSDPPQPPATKPVQPPFIAGSVVPNVTASLNSNAINVNWGAVPSARYVVYYVARNNATGAFGDWTVRTADTNSYSISAPARGVTYYITVLPYGDNPRVYGGFSAYTLVRT